MKVVHFNTFEGGGGAAKASLALHRAMLAQGMDVSLIVHRKTSQDCSVVGLPSSSLGMLRKKTIPWLLSAVHHVLYKPMETWTFGLLGNRSITQHGKVKEADIISLSWVSWFLDIEAIGQLLRQNKPVIWTCYDMWAFTGGCHYSGDCRKFTSQCGCCPQLRSNNEKDLSRWLWNKKKQTWDVSNLTIVCPSPWLARDVQKSGLLKGVRVEVIPTGVDEVVFCSQSKSEARKALDLPQGKKLILFIATRGFSNDRKGGKLLEQSLHILADAHHISLPDVVVLGRKQAESILSEKYTIHSKEFNDDLMLAKLYAACDVLVAPSKADTLPLTVLQSMACGTPCVAFDTGGMGDVIKHKKNGCLVSAFDVTEYAREIEYLLTNEERHQQLSLQCREMIQSNFTVVSEAKQYIRLYEKLLSARMEKEHE